MFPVVREFLDRLNVADRFNAPIAPKGIDEMTVRDYAYIKAAVTAHNEYESERLKEMERSARMRSFMA